MIQLGRHLTNLTAEQLNAAKGRLKTILHRDLFKPVEPLIRSGNCTHVQANVFGYLKRLLLTSVWPIEDATRNNTIEDLLDNLEDFRYTPAAGSCSVCSRDYETIVERVRMFTETYFDGICLDCLDKSRPRTGDFDMDYWKHQEFREDAEILGCRVKHKQPTWYFSFMGRKADRDLFLKRHRSHREM